MDPQFRDEDSDTVRPTRRYECNRGKLNKMLYMTSCLAGPGIHHDYVVGTVGIIAYLRFSSHSIISKGAGKDRNTQYCLQNAVSVSMRSWTQLRPRLEFSRDLVVPASAAFCSYICFL